jgi:hypothetical protein
MTDVSPGTSPENTGTFVQDGQSVKQGAIDFESTVSFLYRFGTVFFFFLFLIYLFLYYWFGTRPPTVPPADEYCGGTSY